jgi:effector-binding domain-containing protein
MLNIGEFARLGQVSDPEQIGPLFAQLGPKLAGHITQAGGRPDTMVGYYDDPEDDGRVGVHVAFEIGDQAIAPGDGIQIVELPVIDVASVVHRGGMENITSVYEELIGWIEDSGYTLAGYSRELYHEIGADGPSVTELQIPIAT